MPVLPAGADSSFTPQTLRLSIMTPQELTYESRGESELIPAAFDVRADIRHHLESALGETGSDPGL